MAKAYRAKSRSTKARIVADLLSDTISIIVEVEDVWLARHVLISRGKKNFLSETCIKYTLINIDT